MEKVQVNIEYCGFCNYKTQCEELREVIVKLVPEAEVQCIKGRQGSFEVQINQKSIHSKLQSMAFPDFEDVAHNVKRAAGGENFEHVRQQAITDCVLQ